MKIVYVRHGQPDYKTDTLTELGHLHAEAAAERLIPYGITEIYSSPLGRARETAEHAARRLGLSVEIVDSFRELGWGDVNAEPGAKKLPPWEYVHHFAKIGQSITDPDWTQKEPWCHNKVVARVQAAQEGFDAFMEQQGYRRVGDHYAVTEAATDKTIAIFGHGGHSTAIFAHLMHLPFPLACQLFRLDFTNISVFHFDTEAGAFTVPRFDMLGNAEHIRDLFVENTFME